MYLTYVLVTAAVNGCSQTVLFTNEAVVYSSEVLGYYIVAYATWKH